MMPNVRQAIIDYVNDRHSLDLHQTYYDYKYRAGVSQPNIEFNFTENYIEMECWHTGGSAAPSKLYVDYADPEMFEVLDNRIHNILAVETIMNGKADRHRKPPYVWIRNLIYKATTDDEYKRLYKRVEDLLAGI